MYVYVCSMLLQEYVSASQWQSACLYIHLPYMQYDAWSIEVLNKEREKNLNCDQCSVRDTYWTRLEIYIISMCSMWRKKNKCEITEKYFCVSEWERMLYENRINDVIDACVSFICSFQWSFSLYPTFSNLFSIIDLMLFVLPLLWCAMFFAAHSLLAV